MPATQTPLAAVRTATIVIAGPLPSASATTPASAAAEHEAESRQNR